MDLTALCSVNQVAMIITAISLATSLMDHVIAWMIIMAQSAPLSVEQLALSKMVFIPAIPLMGRDYATLAIQIQMISAEKVSQELCLS